MSQAASNQVKEFLLKSPSIVVSKGQNDFSNFTSKLKANSQNPNPNVISKGQRRSLLTKVTSFVSLIPTAVKIRTKQSYNSFLESSSSFDYDIPAFIESKSEYIDEGPEMKAQKIEITESSEDQEEEEAQFNLSNYMANVYSNTYNEVERRTSVVPNITKVNAREEFREYAASYLETLFTQIEEKWNDKKKPTELVKEFFSEKSANKMLEKSKSTSNSFYKKISDNMKDDSSNLIIISDSKITENFENLKKNETKGLVSDCKKETVVDQNNSKKEMKIFKIANFIQSAPISIRDKTSNTTKSFLPKLNSSRENHKDTSLNLDSSQLDNIYISQPNELPQIIKVPRSKLNDESSFLNKSQLSAISEDKDFSAWLKKQPKLKNMQKLFDVQKEKERLQQRMKAMEEQIELLREVVIPKKHSPHLQNKNRFEIFYDVDAHEKASTMVRRFNLERKKREDIRVKKFEKVIAEMKHSADKFKVNRLETIGKLNEERKEKVIKRIKEHKEKQLQFQAKQKGNKVFVKDIYKSAYYYKYSPHEPGQKPSPFLEKELAAMKEREEKETFIRNQDILHLADTSSVQIQHDSFNNVVFVKRDVPDHVKEARSKVLMMQQKVKHIKGLPEDLRAWRVHRNLFVDKPNLLYKNI